MEITKVIGTLLAIGLIVSICALAFKAWWNATPTNARPVGRQGEEDAATNATPLVPRTKEEECATDTVLTITDLSAYRAERESAAQDPPEGAVWYHYYATNVRNKGIPFEASGTVWCGGSYNQRAVYNEVVSIVLKGLIDRGCMSVTAEDVIVRSLSRL